jgi:hypothetical protein
VYPIHNGSCHKQQMINNEKLNHGKPQLQLWIDSLNEMFLSRWTAHEQWNIAFILLKTRREEGMSLYISKIKFEGKLYNNFDNPFLEMSNP